MVWIALVFVLGVLAPPGRWLPGPLLWGCAAAFSALAWRVRKSGRSVAALLLLSVLCLGMLRSAAESEFPDWLLRRAVHIDDIVGAVVTYPDCGTTSISFTVQPDGLPGRLVVFWRVEQPVGRVYVGDRVRVVGVTRRPRPFDGFDYPSYLARQGVFATLFAEEVVVLPMSSSRWTIPRWGDRARQWLLGQFRRVLPPDVAALVQSLLLGDRSALDERVEDAFEQTGLLHLLAVSGLHLGIFLGAIWWMLRWAGVRPRIAYPLVAVWVACSLIVVGPRVSLVRAALLFAFLAMGSVLADCGVILKRWIHPLNGVAAAVICLVLLRPGALYEAGFQLTVAATASILIALTPNGWATCLMRSLHRIRRRRATRWMIDLLVVSAAAQIGAAPIIAWHFEAFHPLGVLFNPLVIPWAAVSLWTALLSIPWLPSSMAAVATGPLIVSVRGLGAVVQGLSKLPGVLLPVIPSLGAWMAGSFSLLLLAHYALGGSSCTSNSTSIDPERGEGGSPDPR